MSPELEEKLCNLFMEIQKLVKMSFEENLMYFQATYLGERYSKQA